MGKIRPEKGDDFKPEKRSHPECNMPNKGLQRSGKIQSSEGKKPRGMRSHAEEKKTDKTQRTVLLKGDPGKEKRRKRRGKETRGREDRKPIHGFLK